MSSVAEAKAKATQKLICCPSCLRWFHPRKHHFCSAECAPLYGDRAMAARLESCGWTVLTRGWPDLLCFKPEEDGTWSIAAVELKRGKDKLRPQQEIMRRVFNERLGVPFLVAYDAHMPSLPDMLKRAAVKCGRVVSKSFT